MEKQLETQVLIIGGGVTGTGVARDLALRGVSSVVVEKKDLNAGASGANHGLLHSGGRYVASDPETSAECKAEGDILKKMAPGCIEKTGGLFVAVEGDDENYIADFPHWCSRAGIPVRKLSPQQAREDDPALSSKIIAAYEVEDASIDPFKLTLENMDHAVSMGSRLLRHTEVIALDCDSHHIRQVRLRNNRTGEDILIEPQQVVNAAGAWARNVAALAGISIDLIYSKGSLLISDNRLTSRVINRLRPASDGDILVPGGTVSLLGTTSIRVPSPEGIRPTVEEIDAIIEYGSEMVPVLQNTRFIRAYSGVRPLIGTQSGRGDRSVSRGFALFDHEGDGLRNFVTISGGKLTTFRYMAEKTADLICERLGVTAACRTRSEPLPESKNAQWTEPGRAPREWVKQKDPKDTILCECEMVPRSVIDSIVASLRRQDGNIDLRAIGLRSRIGKGLCQGAFCGIRITAHMYDQQNLTGGEGVENLRQFLNGRWKGIRPVLWNTSLVQEELQEALHCGLFGLEL